MKIFLIEESSGDALGWFTSESVPTQDSTINWNGVVYKVESTNVDLTTRERSSAYTDALDVPITDAVVGVIVSVVP